METTSTVQRTFAEMWRTRPPRIPEKQGGKAVMGGVCEGIGVRYQIDPVVIRVAFVALSLIFGGGLLLYFLCWINMPRFGMTLSPLDAVITPKAQLDTAGRKEKDTGWALLVALLFFTLTAGGVGEYGVAGTIITLALGTLGWWGLHSRLPLPPDGVLAAPRATDADAAAPETAPFVDTSHLTPPEGYPHPGAGRTTPPSWDPLGTAPQLWHLPDLEPERGGKKQRERRHRTLRFWIPVALALFVFLCTLFAVGDSVRYYNFHGNAQGAGSLNLDVEDLDTLPQLRRIAGDTTLDLSDVQPLEQERIVEVGSYVGTIDITVPDNVPVQVHCAVGIGTTNCPDSTTIINEGAEGATLTIDARQFIGNVTVRSPATPTQ